MEHRIEPNVLKNVRSLNDAELVRIVNVFDVCMECWGVPPEKCKYQRIRKKIGIKPCHRIESKKFLKAKGMV